MVLLWTPAAVCGKKRIDENEPESQILQNSYPDMICRMHCVMADSLVVCAFFSSAPFLNALKKEVRRRHAEGSSCRIPQAVEGIDFRTELIG